FVTEKTDIVLVPAKAIRFTPDSTALAAYNQSIPESGAQASEPQAPPINTDAFTDQQAGGEGQTVWIKQGAIIHPQKITVGVTDEIHYEVLSGLNEGDEVVVSATSTGSARQAATAVKSPFMPQRPGSNRTTTTK
ncbi:MAG: hypothetical protein Q8T04_06395, partial [Bacteroidota bacterium]|nr:hypothetical protein [Bacteroidota bacterium]